MKRRTTLDFLLIFAFAAVLIWPLFKAKYLDKWASIESTFIADARFLRDHWPHPLWQPLWYGGTRFDYVYPPALRYGSAVITKVHPKVLPARAYHLYTAFFYCIGIAGVYLLVRVMSGSRGAGWLAAVSTALVSPSFLFLKEYRGDAWLRVPQRLGVLIRYGEGPHMTALAVLPIAMAASYLALRQRRPAMLALAGAACALVVSNNFYGATALAIWFPILLWSVWITGQDRRVFLRAAGIAALACGLTAFWLVPSYFTVTLENMRLVSHPGNAWSRWVLLAAGLLFGFVTGRRAKGRPERAWEVFVAGTLLFFGLNVVGNHFLNFRVIGEPGRLVPELDLALTLAAVEGLRRLWTSGVRWRQATAVLATAAGLGTAHQYAPRAWHILIRDNKPDERVEYRMQDWVARNLPGQRVAVSGSVRFWYNAWNDLPQLGGGSEQGLINQTSNIAHVRVLMEDSGARAAQWLKSFGVDAIIIHLPESQEIYKDVVHPRKFDNVLPLLHDSGQGDLIYRVPRRFPGLARVVDRRKLESIAAPGGRDSQEIVDPYVEMVENGPDQPARAEWEGTDALRVAGEVRDGQVWLVMVTYDPGWHAYANGRELAVGRDPMGQIWIDAPPGTRDARLVFELPLENRIGRGIFAVAAAAFFVLLIAGRRRQGIATGHPS